MAMWLYQIDQKNWNPARYRLEIWESERWVWHVGKIVHHGEEMNPGDTVVFFCAPSTGAEPGFYGWAIVLEWKEDSQYIYFRPTSPSDYLKMVPWWDTNAKNIADKIRGKFKQGTLWFIPQDLAKEINEGIHQWIGGIGTF
ncbi:hypothetical protein [Sulfurospirillum halorespirans]|uniref:EVE domain-containing protein n=1 Tax=Sulfurospirillum halorespirans DSM 13726 TaxID=1193502 RepID=A0A1D7TJ97_9BACT|nr:hypothetical protein [Sulfurospirillum halorespirans]AOO65000.1 hypothetical protein SHALO_1222 [Sulfurospirillum halorespirans DSM 13726]